MFIVIFWWFLLFFSALLIRQYEVILQSPFSNTYLLSHHLCFVSHYFSFYFQGSLLRIYPSRLSSSHYCFETSFLPFSKFRYLSIFYGFDLRPSGFYLLICYWNLSNYWLLWWVVGSLVIYEWYTFTWNWKLGNLIILI